MNRIYRTKFRHSKYSLVVYLGEDAFAMGGGDKCIDFRDIKGLVDSVIDRYDHIGMGDISCEKLGELLHREITEMFIDKWGMICSDIELYETEHFGVRYP